MEAIYSNRHDFKISATGSKLVISLMILLDPVTASPEMFTEKIIQV
jgi:hypothetical protein